jgi:hypothetical protein
LYQERVRDRLAKEEAAGAAATIPSPSAHTTSEHNAPVTAPPSTMPSTENVAKPKTSSPTQATSTAPGAQPTPATKSPEDLNSAQKDKESETTQPGELSGDNAKPTPPESASRNNAAASTTASSAPPFEVTVRAKDRAWVSIKSDGKFTVRGIINPDDVKTVHATDRIVLWTGNAGAVEVSFNGQRVPLEGGPNTEGVLVFNAHGVVIPRPAVTNQEPQ